MRSLEKVMLKAPIKEFGINKYGYNKYGVRSTMFCNFSIKDIHYEISAELSPNEGVEIDWERIAILEATLNYKQFLHLN